MSSLDWRAVAASYVVVQLVQSGSEELIVAGARCLLDACLRILHILAVKHNQ